MKGFRFLAILLLASCILPLASSLAQGPTRIIFLHHSCGQNLINEGGVREGLTDLGYAFYDHGYNGEGLRDADGSYTGRNFDVPGDNTDPDGIAEIFQQPLHDPPDNTFSHLMQYDVIAFKSCFPTSNIGSEEQLNEYKGYYLSVRDRMDEYPDKLFVVVTQPPQVPGASDRDEARRARALADWLRSDEFLSGHPNVVTFDFFGLLAGADDFLRPEYRNDDYDAHPNARANREIGPQFVAFIDEAIRSYLGDGPPPRPAATPLPSGEATEPVLVVAPPAAGVIDDFESGVDAWFVDIGASATTECDPDAEAHGGATALRMQYDVPAEGWGGCGHAFDARQDWSSADGLALWLRADAGRRVVLAVFAGDPEEPTPFEVAIEVGASWNQFSFQWADFAKAEWVGDAGLPAFDPAQVVSYALYADEGDVGTIWADDVALVTSVADEEPTATASTPTEEPVLPTEELGEDDQHGPICGAAALPLGALGVFWVARRRRKSPR
jgi:MYXO-CTERM domain-containing protein